MKPVYVMLVALLATFILSGCGQKGPLYLPQAENSRSTPPK